MKPIGPLMWEHRLIEKMLASMMRHIDQVEKSKKVNPLIIDMAVDFVRTYADRTHHGKEEEILFRDLAKKNLTPELKKSCRSCLTSMFGAERQRHRWLRLKKKICRAMQEKLTEIIRSSTGTRQFLPKARRKRGQTFLLSLSGIL